MLNENQFEQSYLGVAALQRSINGADVQLSYFTPLQQRAFRPRYVGDLIFNGVASDVYRSSLANGVTERHRLPAQRRPHTARRLTAAHRKDAGDQHQCGLPSMPPAAPVDAPFTIVDPSNRLGYTVGALSCRTNGGSPTGSRSTPASVSISIGNISPSISSVRASASPGSRSTARRFTPATRACSRRPRRCSPRRPIWRWSPNTTQQPSVPIDDPVRAERADVYDVGVVQQILPGLEAGVDAYYKKATNLIDDGQFGAAYVLTAFNYAQGENAGVELSTKYKSGSFQAYGNLAVARADSDQPVSNQFLFDNATPLADLGGLTEFQYLQTHWVFTDHTSG